MPGRRTVGSLALQTDPFRKASFPEDRVAVLLANLQDQKEGFACRGVGFWHSGGRWGLCGMTTLCPRASASVCSPPSSPSQETADPMPLAGRRESGGSVCLQGQGERTKKLQEEEGYTVIREKPNAEAAAPAPPTVGQGSGEL